MDVKSFLHSWCAKKSLSPCFDVRATGPKHRQRFLCEVRVDGITYVGAGNSTTKKEAQTNASRDFVNYLVRVGEADAADVPEDCRVKTEIVEAGTESLQDSQNQSQPKPVFQEDVLTLQLSETETSNTEADQEVQNLIFVTTKKTSTKRVQPNKIMQKMESLIETCKMLQENQNILYNAIQSLEGKVDYISTMFDAFVGRNSTHNNNSDTTSFLMISDKKSLDEFEEKLKIPSFQADIKKQLTLVCGKGKGRGYNNAYVLADIMFSRQFLTQCSWAGGSRKQFSKICFKAYTATVNLFFQIIHHSDNNFTMLECEAFLKSIMRHSNTRNKQAQRAPASKRRPKKQVKVSNQPTESDNQSAGSVNQLSGNDNQSTGYVSQLAGVDNQPTGPINQSTIGDNQHAGLHDQHIISINQFASFE